MLLIVDANVLIDYLKADESILQLAAMHLGTVYVPREIVDEVDQAEPPFGRRSPQPTIR